MARISINVFLAAVKAWDEHMDTLCELVGEVECDDAIHDKVQDLIADASYAVLKLSPRARAARLRSIWKNFLHEQEVKELQGDSLLNEAIVEGDYKN